MAKKTLNISTKHIKIKKASSTVFAAVAVASIVISFSIVFLNILWQTSQYNSRVHSAQESVRDTLNANLDTVEDLQSSFANLEVGAPLVPNQPADKKNSEVILDALPSKFDYPALVSSINNLAENTDVSLSSFAGNDLGEQAVQKTNKPTTVEIPLTVGVEGSYDSVKKFLKGIEDSIRPFEIETIDISGTDSLLRVNVSLNTYYQPAFDLELTSQEVQ